MLLTNTIKNSSLKGMHPNKSKSDWTKQLFASAETGLKPYDKLRVIRDRKTLCEFEFRSSRTEIVIGSHSTADILLDAAKVSKFHAKVSCKKGQYQIEDLGSEQGTYLKGKKMLPNKAVEISNGASVRIMAFQICFELEENQPLVLPALELLVNPAELVPVKRVQAPQSSIAANSDREQLALKSWDQGTTELKVIEIIDETNDVKTYRFIGVKPLLFAYLPGQFITLLLTIDGKEVQRSYSMCSSPSRPHTLDLTVKRVPGGLVSNWLCDHLKLGDTLKVKGPCGHFSCLQKPSNKLLFIGAGSGVTPLMSMTRWLFDTQSIVDTKVLFSFHNEADVIYRKELEMMKRSGKSLDIAVTLTGKKSRNKNSKTFSRRIDKAMLERFTKDLAEREVFLCGPEAFMNDVKKILKALNFPMHHLHCERFSSSQNSQEPKPHFNPSKPNNNEKFCHTTEKNRHTVTFSKSNKVVQTDEQTSLLQLAEREGVEIDFNCKTGACAECMVKCLSGQIEMNENCDIDDDERKQGWVFSCCAFAHSDVVINA